MKNNKSFADRHKKLTEDIIHIIFLIFGLITVAFVLLITVYLIIAGIPAIRKIGLIKFLFGTKWASTAAEPEYGILPFILHQYLRHGRRDSYRSSDRISHRGIISRR